MKPWKGILLGTMVGCAGGKADTADSARASDAADSAGASDTETDGTLVTGRWTGTCEADLTTTGQPDHIAVDNQLDLVEDPPGDVAGSWSYSGTYTYTTTTQIGEQYGSGSVSGTHEGDVVELSMGDFTKSGSSTTFTYSLGFELVVSGDSMVGPFVLSYGGDRVELQCQLTRE